MMKQTMKKALFLCAILAGSICSANTIGVVSLNTCLSDSKLGKAEQANFETLRKQMTSHFESSEKELNEVAGKLNDPEYMDGLSPEAEMELREKARSLNEELMRYQNQFYQVMNQAQTKSMNLLGSQAAAASEVVAKAKKLDAVLNKEVCFYTAPALDITPLVIIEMDKKYDEEQKKAG